MENEKKFLQIKMFTINAGITNLKETFKDKTIFYLIFIHLNFIMGKITLQKRMTTIVLH